MFRAAHAAYFLGVFFLDLTGQLDVVFYAVEGAGDRSDGACGLPVRRLQLLPRGQGQDLAGLGTAPSRARPRSAAAARTSCSKSIPTSPKDKLEGSRHVRRTCAAPRWACRPHRPVDAAKCSITTPIRRGQTAVEYFATARPCRFHVRPARPSKFAVAEATASRLTPTDAGSPSPNAAMAQVDRVIRRRVDELGTREPTIQRQGSNRILVQVPGLQDPTALEGAARQDRQARIQLVDSDADRADRRCRAAVARGVEVLTDSTAPALRRSRSRSWCRATT